MGQLFRDGGSSSLSMGIKMSYNYHTFVLKLLYFDVQLTRWMWQILAHVTCVMMCNIINIGCGFFNTSHLSFLYEYAAGSIKNYLALRGLIRMKQLELYFINTFDWWRVSVSDTCCVGYWQSDTTKTIIITLIYVFF
jgi:hypothetical protein